MEFFLNVIYSNISRYSKIELHYKSGRKHIMRFSTYPVKENKKLKSVLVVGKDITREKETENKMHEVGEKYLDLFENANDLIQSVRSDGSFLYVNRAWKRTLGYNQDEISNLSFLDIIHPESREYCMKLFKRLMSGEIVGNIEVSFVTKGGRKIIVEGSINCRFENGKAVSTRGIFHDITKRKKMEERLQESEEKFHALYESATDAIMLLDENGFFDCNAATLKIFGVPTMNRFTSKHPHDLSPPKQPDGKDSLAAFNEHIATAFEKGSDYFEWMHKCADGTIFPATVLLNHMKLKDRDILQAVVRDITGQRRSEGELKKKINELERYKKATVGRELRLIEIKKELKELRTKLEGGK